MGSTGPVIPFNFAGPIGAEAEYVAQSLASGHMSASGVFAGRAAAILAADSGAQEVLLTTSCTAALEMSALLLDLQPGDCVIVPSFTFSTSALAFAREGAQLIFCDIEDQTLGLDPVDVGRLIQRADAAGLRVRAIVAVHYAGVACRVDELQAVLADRPEISLIEDNAHGLFGRHHGKPLGSIGRFACLSFHETKNISCGEGGALLLNDPADVDRARVLYDKGTNRRAFMLGQVDKYTWVDNGSSFGLADTLAAFLTGQLEERERIQAHRRHVFERYQELLSPLAARCSIRLPVLPDPDECAYHMFYVLFEDRTTRDKVLADLNAESIRAVFHYIPLHSSVAGERFAALRTECPVSEDISGRLLRLPFFNTLDDAAIDRVVGCFRRSLQGVPA